MITENDSVTEFCRCDQLNRPLGILFCSELYNIVDKSKCKQEISLKVINTPARVALFTVRDILKKVCGYHGNALSDTDKKNILNIYI